MWNMSGRGHSPVDTSCIGISWCPAVPPDGPGDRGRGRARGRDQGTPWPRWWVAAPAPSSSPRPRPGARTRLLTPASLGRLASNSLRPSPAEPRHCLLRLLKHGEMSETVSGPGEELAQVRVHLQLVTGHRLICFVSWQTSIKSRVGWIVLEIIYFVLQKLLYFWMIYCCNWGFGAQMILATARLFLHKSVFDYWNGKPYLSAGVVVALWGSSSGRCRWATCRGGGGCSRGSCARPWRTSSGPGPGSRPPPRPRLPRPRPRSWNPSQQARTSTIKRSRQGSKHQSKLISDRIGVK